MSFMHSSAWWDLKKIVLAMKTLHLDNIKLNRSFFKVFFFNIERVFSYVYRRSIDLGNKLNI